MNKYRDPLTYSVIGEAMTIHSALGPGLDEEIYHQEISQRLATGGGAHLSKPRRNLIYRDYVSDTFEADLVFENELVVELKSLRGGFAKEHITQALCYLKFWKIRTGLLLDFGHASLIHRRLIYTSKQGHLSSQKVPEFVTDSPLAKRIISSISRCLDDIGLGYRESTWIGLACAALRADGLDTIRNPIANIKGRGLAKLRCLVVQGRCAISITALGSEVSASDRAALQTCLRWLNLPFGIAFHFGKDQADMKFVASPDS